jgi:hypothetical protein
MNKAMKTLIVIPAYNEGKNIREVIEGAKKEMPTTEILVIDDGSSDNTSLVSQETEKAAVATLPYNLGIGGAVQTGFKYAQDHGYEIVARLDGDGQHSAEDIAKVIEPLLRGEADMVIGSRFLGSDRPHSILARQIGQKAVGFVLTIVTGQRITDATSGFRGYNQPALDLLNKYYPSDYPEPEEIVFLRKNKFRIKEVPVSMKEREAGSSSIKSIRYLYYAIKVSLSIFISILRSPILKK